MVSPARSFYSYFCRNLIRSWKVKGRDERALEEEIKSSKRDEESEGGSY